jgi:hypothetical protein
MCLAMCYTWDLYWFVQLCGGFICDIPVSFGIDCAIRFVVLMKQS